MNGLLEEGLGLMVLGMGFVFLFLVVLIYTTRCMSRLIECFFSDKETMPLSAAKPTAAKQSTSVAASNVDAKVAAAITAAVHQHRNK